MSRNPNSARAKSAQTRTDTGFEKEYKEVRDLNSGTLKLLADKQTELEVRMKFLAKKKLVDIHGNQTEMTAMKTEATRARKLIMATGKYVTVDLKTTLTKLEQTTGKFAVLMQKKLNEEFDEYGSVDAEAFVSIMKEMQEMRDFAQQLNSSIAEMEAEIYLAAVQILSAERDMKAVNDVIQGRVRKEKEVQKQREEESRRLEEEKKRKKEEEKKAKEESSRRKKEEEEQRKREEEERKRQREEEEKRMRMEEEERRRIEEELEKQRVEEEERKRIEEEKRRAKEEELERKRKKEEERVRKLEEEARMEDEKRRKQEEERKRREEEEKQKQEEEERKRKADPNNWTNVLVYDVENNKDGLGHGIACVIRVPDDVTLDKHDFVCTVLETSINRYKLAENEELVSNTINIRPSGQSLEFPSALWMAIPFSSAFKTRETVIKLQYLIQSDSTDTAATEKLEWIDVPTRDAVIQSGKVKEQTRFVETELRHLSSEGMDVVVITKPKMEKQIFNSKGGQLRSNIDQRLAVTVPKNAFKSPTAITIQAIPVDSTVLKERYDGCDHLLGTSPVVLIRCQAGPQKPLILTIPSPSGSGRRSRPKTSINDRRSSKGQYLRPSTSMASREDNAGENDDKDFVSLVTRDASRRWRYRDEISLDVGKESTEFEMSNMADRMLLIRTNELLPSSELIKIAQNLDRSLEDRLVSILVRQNPSDLNNLYVECCKREVATKRIQSLFDDQQLTQGPSPNQVLFKEGDLVEVSFTGNIHFEDRQPRLLTYHSNLASPRFFAGIKEMDGFSQNALDNYRGTMRLTLVDRSYKPPVKFLGQRTTSATTETGFICEFSITLPKPPKEITRPRKIHLPLATQGPLTDEYFDHLSDELGEDWKMLAMRLKFSPASVQRITADHGHVMNGDEATQRSARQMLSEWFRGSSKVTDKVEKLQFSLESVGRTELAEELDRMNRKYKEDSDRKQNSAQLMKCIKAYSDSQAAVNEWRSVGQGLGLESDDLETISRSEADGIREQARTMLMRWIDVRGEKATKDSLIRCLKKLNLNEAVGKVKLIV